MDDHILNHVTLFLSGCLGLEDFRYKLNLAIRQPIRLFLLQHMVWVHSETKIWNQEQEIDTSLHKLHYQVLRFKLNDKAELPGSAITS